MRTSTLLFAALLASYVCPANAGRIVVHHDEWTTSNTGFTTAGPANATSFVQNVADFLNIGGGTGNFLVYSTNFGLTQSSFATALTSAGHTLTVSTAVTFDLATLLTYDGVFLALPPTGDTSVLTDYVNAGGGVYIAAGTAGIGGGATAEANAWNPFLNAFGLGLLGGAYNGVSGNIAIAGGHPIFSGVSQLYQNNGSTVVLFGANPNAQIVQQTGGGIGLTGVYDDTAAVPEPSAGLLLLTGIGAVGVFRRRKTRS